MKNVVVTLQGSGTYLEYRLRLALDSTVSNVRLNAQTLLGFDDTTCQLILDRTQQGLPDAISLREADIQSGDILTVMPFYRGAAASVAESAHEPAPISEHPLSSHPLSSAVISGGQAVSGSTNLERNNYEPLFPYSLSLIVLSEAAPASSYEYVIQLNSRYESDPSLFFEAYGRQEYQKFIDFLESALEREVSAREINRVIRDWCEDIRVGYKTTRCTLKR